MTVTLPVLRCATCDTAYVLRLAFSLGSGDAKYIWQRDCKHKTADHRRDDDAVVIA